MLKLTDDDKLFEHCKVYEKKTENRTDDAFGITDTTILSRT